MLRDEINCKKFCLEWQGFTFVFLRSKPPRGSNPCLSAKVGDVISHRSFVLYVTGIRKVPRVFRGSFRIVSKTLPIQALQGFARDLDSKGT